MKRPGIDRWIRICLLAYPTEFRRRHGEELTRLYQDLYQGEGLWDGLRGASRIFLDALRQGLAARWERRFGTAPSLPQSGPWRSLFFDLRVGARALSRRPFLAVPAILIMALGIGVNTAVFTVVDRTLLRPLPYRQPERLVQWMGLRREGDLGPISYLNFLDWRERSGLFGGAAAYDEWRPNLTGEGPPERLNAATVSADFFRVLGVQPALGRDFLPEEDIDGRDRVVILTDGLWRRRFGGAEAAIGRRIQLNGTAHEIVGVLPPQFEDPLLSGLGWGRPQIFRPLGLLGVQADRLPRRGSHSYTAIARLAPGANLKSAQQEMNALTMQLTTEHPVQNAGLAVVVVPLFERVVGDVRSSVWLLMGAVALLLVVAVANVAHLLLGGVLERRGEIALRKALGAGRARLFRQFLAEGLLLTVPGALIGLVGGLWVLGIFTAMGQDGLPRLIAASFDGRVLIFALLIAFAVVLICALAPMAAVGPDLQSPLRGSVGVATVKQRRLRSLMVVGEVALSIMLLVFAGLLSKSFWKLSGVDPGFEAADVLTFDLAPSAARYPAEALDAFYAEVLSRLQALPGVRSAAAANILPLKGSFDGIPIFPEDRPQPPPGQSLNAEARTVTSGFFKAIGMRLIQGRGIGAGDRVGSAPVVVVSRSLADRFWPGQEAPGQRLNLLETSTQVVGVVDDVKHMSLDVAAPLRIYTAFSQGLVPWQKRRLSVVVGCSSPIAEVLPLVRREIHALDPELPLSQVASLDGIVDSSLARPRFRTWLLAVFAGLAVTIAGVGLYGALACMVNERRGEIAVRMALGARRYEVLCEFLKRGLRIALLGAAAGVVGAWATSRVLDGMLFQVSSTDWGIYAGVVAAVILFSLLSAYRPAKRASAIDPVRLLRQ